MLHFVFYFQYWQKLARNGNPINLFRAFKPLFFGHPYFQLELALSNF